MKVIDYFIQEQFLSEDSLAMLPAWWNDPGAKLLSPRGKPGLLDRTGVYQCAWHRANCPMPAYQPDFRATFAEVACAVAKSLIAESKILQVSWSGGIDSTAILAALKAVSAPKDQVEVLYNTELEYQTAISFVEQNFTATMFDEPVAKGISADKLFVTGEGGDFLFFAWNHELLKKVTARNPSALGESPEIWLSQQNVVDSHFVQALMKSCPIPCDRLQTLIWYRNFALRWQNLYYRQGQAMDLTRFNELVAVHRPFYMVDQFQLWSMAHNATIPTLPADRLTHKQPAKDFIQAVMPDADYFATKAAQPSFRAFKNAQPVPGNGPHYFRFEDGELITHEADFLLKVTK